MQLAWSRTSRCSCAAGQKLEALATLRGKHQQCNRTRKATRQTATKSQHQYTTCYTVHNGEDIRHMRLYVCLAIFVSAATNNVVVRIVNLFLAQPAHHPSLSLFRVFLSHDSEQQPLSSVKGPTVLVLSKNLCAHAACSDAARSHKTD